jgi:GNAT superfamily N-acetyltransferase
VYVAVRGEDKRVLAYSALSAGTFMREHLLAGQQRGFPGVPLPTVHLGRLAVDLSCRGQRLGELLLFHFLKAACDVADRIGIYAVDLFSKDDDARQFYLKCGFIALQDNPFHLYMPMDMVRAMFEQRSDT